MTVLLVALGAALGAPARLLVSRRWPGRPGTLLVNVVGSLLIGVVAGRADSTYALVAVGFCGSFTTFSTFAVEAVETVSWRYAALTTISCLAAAGTGLLVGGGPWTAS